MVRQFVAGLLVLCPTLALANGRIPTSVGFEPDHDPQQPILASMTFGMFLSHDAGRTYRWVCEQALGIVGNWDPQYAQTPDGRIYATTPQMGVTRSSDGGCTFRPVPGIEGYIVSRLTHTSDRRTLLASTSSTAKRNAVFISTDGDTFRETAIASDRLVFDWVEVSTADPMRIYAGALAMTYEGPELHVSTDGGLTEVTRPVPEPTAHQIQILGVSAQNPDTTWVRVRVGAVGKIFRTTDAGVTFREVFSGSISAAGYEPTSGALYLATPEGLRRSTDGGDTWTTGATDPRPRCFGFDRDQNIIACTFNYGNALLAKSTDGGMTFAPYLEISPSVVLGTLGCPAGTPVKDMCEPLWPGLADQLGLGQPGAGGTGGAGGDGGAGAGVGGAAGAGGAGTGGGSGGGAAGSGTAGSGGGSAGSSGNPAGGGKSGGCSTGGAAVGSLPLLLLVAWTARRRSRR